MTKDDLAEKLYVEGDVGSRAAGRRAVDTMLDVMTKALASGEDVRLGGFVNIKAVKRNARVARNPATGDTIKVAAKVAVKFKAAKHLADAVNTKKLLKKLS